MQIWLTADSHFGHANMAAVFAKADGTKVRGFASAQAQDDRFVSEWNARVKPEDHVWHLGDYAFDRTTADRIFPQLQGHKRIVLGNHDRLSASFYPRAFQKVRGMYLLQVDGVLLMLTHAPVAPWSYSRKWLANVHGHVHEKRPLGYRIGHADVEAPCLTYCNVCVEQTAWAPIAVEEVIAEARKTHLPVLGHYTPLLGNAFDHA